MNLNKTYQRYFTDINEKALTFQTKEAYLKKNYLVNNETDAEKHKLKKMMTENVLMNLRTYDYNALVLYANDNLNNFIHIFIHNGTRIFYLFNDEDEIIQMNVTCTSINKGESIQIAIIREKNSTTLHVNEKNTTVDRVAKLLMNYTNKPWENPELGSKKNTNNFDICIKSKISNLLVKSQNI